MLSPNYWILMTALCTTQESHLADFPVVILVQIVLGGLEGLSNGGYCFKNYLDLFKRVINREQGDSRLAHTSQP